MCKAWDQIAVNVPPSSSSLPVVDCGTLPSPENGEVVLSEGTQFLATAEYTCEQLFVLEGEDIRTCLPSGEWSGEEPVCSRESAIYIC